MGTGAALLVLVIAQILLGQIGIVRADLTETVAGQRQVVDALRVEVAQLSAPARIATRAEELGMKRATDIAPLSDPSTVRGPSPMRGRP